MPLVDTEHPLRQWIDPLYGPTAFTSPKPDAVQSSQPYVLHVTALAHTPDRGASQADTPWGTLRIGPEAPQSELDFVALQFARARADAILITGQVLRDEPTLDYAFAGPAAGALADYRRAVLAKAQLPAIVVLTRSGRIDPEHPLLNSSFAAHVLTSPAGADRLPTAQLASVTAFGEDGPDLSEAVRHIHTQLAAQTLSLEAGPSTSRALYEPARPGETRPHVDELLLSVFEASPDEDRPATTAAPFGPREIERLLPICAGAGREAQASGMWRFERRLRRT